MLKHYLSELNTENRTALCKKCGPVSVLWRANAGRFQCAIARRESRGNYGGTTYKYDGGSFYLTGAQVAALKEGKSCELCGSVKELRIDHCHTTGKIRGILCTHCNLMLGHAKDNVEVLEKAIAYLKN